MQSLNMNAMARRTAAVQQLRIVDTQASSIKGNDDDNHPDNVTTEDRDETWQSGRPAPGYIDLDLGSSATIEAIDLLPYQVPTPATTRHRIYVGDSKDDMQLAQEVSQETKHHAWVSGVPVGMTGRYVRVETVDHPGWVAWSGIKVYGSQGAT